MEENSISRVKRESYAYCAIRICPGTTDAPQSGVRRELDEVGGEKMQFGAKFTLTLLPQPQISHLVVAGHRASSLDRSVPRRIRRIRDSLAFPFIRISSCERAIKASPPQIHPISPTSKSTPMNRQFPPEIIQLIVNASLKPYDVFESPATDAKMRYSLRKSYALLNSTWRGATQAELVKWVEIRTEDWAKKFLEFAEQRGGSVDGVKDMFVYSAHFTDARTLAKLLRCVPQLINFYVYGGSVDIYDLAQLQKLRRLELDNCSIVGTPSSSQRRLSQLQRLSIRDCPFEDSALQFLTPTFLPQLRRVDTPGLSIMAPLIPQLEIINARSGYGDFHLLARAKSLLLLPLPHSADKRLDMLANLPSLPPFLYPVIPPYNAVDASEELADALEDLLGTKKSGLRVILLKEYGIDDSIRSLIQRFEERGVRVQLVDLDFEGAIIEMEEIRANEKRAAEAAEARRR